MKKIFILPFIAMVFFSCQKEMSVDTINNSGGNNNNGNDPVPLEGNWSFLNLYMNFSSSASTRENGVEVKFVTACETTSINNKGDMSFASDKFTATKLGYSIDDTVYVTTYIMGIPQPEVEKIEFGGDVPPYSASGKYQKIGNDSLYFPDGSAFQGLEVDGQPITSSAASGAKYVIKSDTLLVYQGVKISKDTIMDIGGQSIKFRIDQNAITIGSFKKK